MIRFACPTCQKVLKAPDEGAGRKVNCPKCSQRLIIPPPARQQTVFNQSTAPAPPADWREVVLDSHDRALEQVNVEVCPTTPPGAKNPRRPHRWINRSRGIGACVVIGFVGVILGCGFLRYLFTNSEPATCEELVALLRSRGMTDLSWQSCPSTPGNDFPSIFLGRGNAVSHVNFFLDVGRGFPPGFLEELPLAVIEQRATAREAKERAGGKAGAIGYGRFVISSRNGEFMREIKNALHY